MKASTSIDRVSGSGSCAVANRYIYETVSSGVVPSVIARSANARAASAYVTSFIRFRA